MYVFIMFDGFNCMITDPRERFTVKISGLEICNENVRDLSNSESGRNLKLLSEICEAIHLFGKVEEHFSHGIEILCYNYFHVERYSG